jgi:hypothetical protein
VPDGSITASKLSSGAVTSEKIASGAVLTNLGDSGMQAVPAGGLIISADETLLNNTDYNQIGVVTQPDEAPSPRFGHSAVWTGKEMTIFGGLNQGFAVGGGVSYNPETGLWKSLPKSNSPSSRYGHCALWTGEEMIIWGGYNWASFDSGYGASGAIYNPKSNAWKKMSGVGAPPGGFAVNRAVWTGAELIVWGGIDGDMGPTNYGARYDPKVDSWSAMNSVGAPDARAGHFMVWTGESVFVLGGAQNAAKYNPVNNTWHSVSSNGLPFWINQQDFNQDGIIKYGVIWTGELIVVWDFPGSVLHKYDPKLDEWSQCQMHPLIENIYVGTASVSWTGYEIMICGGWTDYGSNKKSFFWNPENNLWRVDERAGDLFYGAGSPSLTKCNEAMILWGGNDNSIGINRGSVYDITSNQWLPMNERRGRFYLFQKIGND